jgi:hypothetical protein
METRTPFSIVLSIMALMISSHVITLGKYPTPEMDQQQQKVEFSDHQKEPIPTLFKGEKAELIKQNLEALFVPCPVVVRKRAEKALVELVSTFKLPDKDSVAVDRTWSLPLNFASPGSRRAVVALLHTGTGAYISIWILCESEDGIKCFFFQGMARYCGYWQIANDIDNNGTPELITKHFVGEYEGGGFSAVWPAIYRWDGKNYVRADDEFPGYYAREVVPKYQKILEEHKDWENHTDQQIRRIYQKCKFVFENAESIARKTKP